MKLRRRAAMGESVTVRFVATVVAVAAACAVSSAQAAKVTYIFSGQITEILDTNNYTTDQVSTASSFTFSTVGFLKIEGRPRRLRAVTCLV